MRFATLFLLTAATAVMAAVQPDPSSAEELVYLLQYIGSDYEGKTRLLDVPIEQRPPSAAMR